LKISEVFFAVKSDNEQNPNQSLAKWNSHCWAKSAKIAIHHIARYCTLTEISGDKNPLHFAEEIAKNTRFGGIVGQGGITSAILNAVVTEDLPGPGTVFLQVNWSFKAPVKPGDTITGEVEVTKVREDKPITELNTRVLLDDGTVVLDGNAVCYTMPIKGSIP